LKIFTKYTIVISKSVLFDIKEVCAPEKREYTMNKNFFFLLTVLCIRLNAQIPDFEPSAFALQYAAERSPYAWQTLCDMALWASGAPDAAAYKQKTAQAVAILQTDPDLPTDARERGEYILRFMHKNYLRRYSLYQTQLDALLDNGTYNCVSSAMFYLILGVSVNLNIQGVITHDHAFVTVNVQSGGGSQKIDVETTNEYGFEPGTQKDFSNEFGQVTGFAYVDPKNYTNRSPVSQLELVSLILMNRISYLERQNHYAAALPLIADRAALLSKRTERTDSPFFTDSQKDFAANLHNLVVDLVSKQRLSDAKTVLDKGAPYLPDENYRVIKEMIVSQELSYIVNKSKTSAEAEETLIMLNDYENIAVLGEERIAQMRSVVLVNEAGFISKEKGWRAAIEFSEKAIAAYGRNKLLEQNLQTFKNNRGVEIHNQFASLWNKGSYAQAQEVLEEGLRDLPNDARLLNDWKVINKQ
jgi:tetratricopeptide (TPR) repeat protein